MKAFTAKLVLAAALVVVCGAASAQAASTQVSIDTHFDRDIGGLDQLLQLTVNVTVHGSGSIDQIELPHSPALQVAGTSQSEQSQFSMGPGGIDSSHSTVYRLSLRPLKTGDFELTPAQVVAGGHTYKGNAVHVKILPAGQGPAPTAPQRQQSPFGNFFGQGFSQPNMPGLSGNDDEDEDPFAQIFGGGRPPSGEDVILGASIDKKKVVLGQQVTYSIKLYTRADISEFSDLKLPGFDGFWGEDLETSARPTPKLQTLGGVPYQVYLLKKKALFPDRAGALNIAPAEIDVTVGLGFFRGRKVHRESTALTVTVDPLPAVAPAAFSATNVGTWVFSEKLSPASVPVGEPATLSLSVDGIGNLRGLTVPSLPAIAGVRAYDPTSTDKISSQADHFGGRRQVDIMLIPQRTGDFEIPPLTFDWYDPATGYQSTTTPRLTLKAVVGAHGAAAGASAPGGQNVLESTYRPLRDNGGLLHACVGGAHRLPAPLSGWPLGLGFGFPPLALGLGAVLRALRRRRAEAAPGLRGRRAYRVARQKITGNPETLTVADVGAALFGYLADRLGETMAGLSFLELRQKLTAHGFEEASIRATLDAVELAETLRYMPVGVAQTKEIEKLRTMTLGALQALEKAARPKERSV